MSTFKTIETKKNGAVAQIILNRLEGRNALNTIMLREVQRAFEEAAANPEIRVVVLSANGKNFSGAIDAIEQDEMFDAIRKQADVARKGHEVLRRLDPFHNAVASIEKCTKPVIAAIHGDCVGKAIELVAACDVRVASADAMFAIRSGRLGQSFLAGPLAILPKVVRSHSWLKEMTFMGTRFGVKDAFQNDLISKPFKNRETMMSAVEEMATLIASKSPVTVQASKMLMNYARDHDLQDTVSYAMCCRQTLFLGQDLQNAIKAHQQKGTSEFKNI
ncbi:hypothetical protein QR680_004897 [Steinernema hermaphroditum]|uniref:Enoyl-CoA hydratase n=1 Tax=Steinernema hermaphroditum TaxID=289476 RepID=A0AA39LTY1_9BILA|nr:hypothetical protein QR680_004897 [Steinernema hermaphroditum]